MDLGQVDGVSVVLGALAAGGTAGLQDVAKGSVSDAWKSLLRVVRNRLGRDDLGVAKLDVFVAEPTLHNATSLRPHLHAGGVGEDVELLRMAHAIFDSEGPVAFGPGSVAAHIIHASPTEGGTTYVGGVHGGAPPDPR